MGLMGNPSDGFNGKARDETFLILRRQTLSVTIRNFWASAEIWESAQLRWEGLSEFHRLPTIFLLTVNVLGCYHIRCLTRRASVDWQTCTLLGGGRAITVALGC